MAEWTGQPAYQQIAEDLRQRIRDGRMPVGTQLPSLAELMKTYDVSITVVRMALNELRAEGLVVTHQGKGAFVRSDSGASGTSPDGSSEFQTLMKHLDDVQDQVRQLAERVSELEQAVRPADAEPAKRARRGGAKSR